MNVCCQKYKTGRAKWPQPNDPNSIAITLVQIVAESWRHQMEYKHS